MKRVAALSVLAVLLIACRKSTPDAAADTAPAPTTPATLVTANDPYPAPPPVSTEGLPTGEQVKPIVETITEDAGPAPAAKPPEDPFIPAINAVQQSGVGCFKGLPPGEYSATISVVVTAAGTATRTEVTSGPADPAVRKCLEQAAQRSYPSSKDGRKLSIDVLVKG
jgi:hypothetical protein